MNVYLITRIAVVVIFLYHGLVPKIIFKSPQEILMNDALMPFVPQTEALLYSGIAEVVYALLLLIFFRKKWLMYPTVLFSVLVTIALLVKLPELFTQAFNPFSINFSIFIFGLLNIYSHNGYSLKKENEHVD